MKTRLIVPVLALMIAAASTTAQQQPEQLNLPGDNLNLYAVMKLFQESETFEIFEQKLNAEDQRINNLDLNGDNYVDYIRVADYKEKDIHYIVLKVAVTPSEDQDVAVFVVKRDRKDKLIIQLIGDEALYGKYYIIEPYYDTDPDPRPNPGYKGGYPRYETVAVHRYSYQEVESWPLVHFVLLPSYRPWHSPWYYGYYPPFWRPWTPWYWHQYYGYHYHWHHHYYGHYYQGHHTYYQPWHTVYYTNYRKQSNTVWARRERGDYNATYSRPESLREGSANFKKQNPGRVRADKAEPELKNIRTAGPEKGYPSGQPGGNTARDIQKESPGEKNSVKNPEARPADIKTPKQEKRSPEARPEKEKSVKKQEPASPPAAKPAKKADSPRSRETSGQESKDKGQTKRK